VTHFSEVVLYTSGIYLVQVPDLICLGRDCDFVIKKKCEMRTRSCVRVLGDSDKMVRAHAEVRMRNATEQEVQR
jgi:hypothetical protein